MAIVTKIANFTNAVLFRVRSGIPARLRLQLRSRTLWTRKRGLLVLCQDGNTDPGGFLPVAEWIAAPYLIELFRKGDPDVLAIGTVALRFQVPDSVPERLADDQQHDDADDR